MLTYFCDDDESFIVGVFSVDREVENIVRILSKSLELDLVECDADDYDEFKCDYSHDTIVVKWKHLESYLEGMGALESKKINVHIVF